MAELSLSVPSYIRGSKSWSHPILKLRVQKVAVPLRPLTEWDSVFVLPTRKEYGLQRGLGSTIQLESCDSLRAGIAHKYLMNMNWPKSSKSRVSMVIEWPKKIIWTSEVRSDSNSPNKHRSDWPKSQVVELTNLIKKNRESRKSGIIRINICRTV